MADNRVVRKLKEIESGANVWGEGNEPVSCSIPFPLLQKAITTIEELEERVDIMGEGAWVSAKERLPKVEESIFGKPFIVYTGNGNVLPLWFVKCRVRGKLVERWQYWDGKIYDYGRVIAWRPLPEPPEGVV